MHTQHLVTTPINGKVSFFETSLKPLLYIPLLWGDFESLPKKPFDKAITSVLDFDQPEEIQHQS